MPYRRRVGLLGGSFNPPHEGHREISLAALERLGLDAVWWLVTPGNPLKDPEQYAPFDERIHLARKFANHCDIVVSDFERRHNLQYTIDTLNRLTVLNPETQFIWLMGADSLANFHRWKNWRSIAELTPIAVFNRPGYNDDALNSEAAQSLSTFRITEANPEKLVQNEPPVWIFFSDTDNPSSSSDIRNAANNSKETPNT
jgi:nicotinate-nucleotide adenylyltransferase